MLRRDSPDRGPSRYREKDEGVHLVFTQVALSGRGGVEVRRALAYYDATQTRPRSK